MHGEAPAVELQVRSRTAPGAAARRCRQRAVLVRRLACAAAGRHQSQSHGARAGRARSSEALALAPEIGIPHQNLVVGDRAGPHRLDHLRAHSRGHRRRAGARRQRLDDGGRSPAHRGSAGRAAVDSQRAGGDRSAPAASSSADDLASLGAEYDLGARAGQIRDDLLALTRQRHAGRHAAHPAR